jgi:hypothetical protein
MRLRRCGAVGRLKRAERDVYVEEHVLDADEVDALAADVHVGGCRRHARVCVEYSKRVKRRHVRADSSSTQAWRG